MVDTSAFDQPEARGLRLIVGSLRVATAVQCFGAAGVQFLEAGGSAVAEMLRAGGRPMPADFVTIDRAVGGLLIACGLFSLTRPCWPVLLPVTLWFLADAIAPLSAGTDWWLFLGPAAKAASVLVPAALMVVDLYPPKAKFSLMRFLVGGSACRAGAVVSFAGLGLSALYDARFGGDLLTTVKKAIWVFRGQTPSDETASYALLVVGAVCFAGAMNLAAARTRGVAAAMVGLGLLLAGANVFLRGPAGALYFLKGVGPAGAALVTFWYWTLSIREREGQLRTKGG